MFKQTGGGLQTLGGYRGQHDEIGIENVRAGSRTIAARLVVVKARRGIQKIEDLGLWGALNSICMAIAIRTAGLGMTTMDLTRTRGCGSNIEYGAELLAEYDRWFSECLRHKLQPIQVRDMVVDGLSFRKLDRRNRQRDGSAFKNLVKCLQLWG